MHCRWFYATVLVLWLSSSALAAPQTMAPEAFTPTVKAPGYKGLQRLGRGAGIGDALAHGKGAPLGGTRFLGVLSSRKQQQVFALVVDGKGGTWRVLHKVELPLTFSAGARGGRCGEDKVAAVGFVGDFDADGKREAKVRTLFCRVVPAIGPVKVRRLAMINLDGVPRVAVHFELGYNALPTAMGAIKAREKYRDLNGDGHPDLLVNQREADGVTGGKVRWKRAQRRFIYDPKTDSYTEKTRRKFKRKSKPGRKRKSRRKRRR